MAPQSSWSGFLKMSLVSCPVRLQPATTRANRIGFHNLDPVTHDRIEMRPHDAESGAEVDRDELVRGYETEPDHYLLIEDSDLESIAIESSRTIDLTTFVDCDEIDAIYYDSPYFMAPDGAVADETFRVIREALRRRKRAGLGHVVLGNRERVVLVHPRDRGMVLITLRTAEEVRGDAEYFADIPPLDPDPEMIDLAKKIIEQRSTKFDPSRFENRHQAALQRLIEAKMRGEKPVSAAGAEPEPSGKVIDLMAALKRSLQEMPSRAPAKGKSAPRQEQEAGQRKRAGAKSARSVSVEHAGSKPAAKPKAKKPAAPRKAAGARTSKRGKSPTAHA